MNLIKQEAMNHIVFAIFLTISIAAAYNDLQYDFPGPYCKQRNTCCNKRQDSCSVPISSTLCYCDQFCDRKQGGDCCPDYESFCIGVAENTTSCLHNNKYYTPYQSFKDNCNTCKCTVRGSTECERDTCITDHDLINNVNLISSSLGWTARNYSEFWGRKYKEGLTLRLGTLEPTFRVKSMSRLTNRITDLPRNFNSLDHWSSLISEVPDQGWCGSSWVISTTSVASDRFAIQSKGQEVVHLSPQNILSCTRRQRGCNGGHLDAAWRFLLKQGVVDEDCYPYTASSNHCKIRRPHSLKVMGCRPPTKVDRDHFYTMGPAYSLNNETDIMVELMNSGPVQATMRIYRDFFSYAGGVYRHSAASRGEEHGFHSVKIVGWGEERSGYKTVKYWTAANSWGPWWGENGYFRILRGENECLIEDYVLASWPHVYNPHVKYAKRFN